MLDDSDENIFNHTYDDTLENEYHVSNLPSVQHYNLLNELCCNFINNLSNNKVLDIESYWNLEVPSCPIKINYEPIEVLPGVVDIVNSDNVFLNKVIQVFTILKAELYNLIGKNSSNSNITYYDSLIPLVVYGETDDDSNKIEDGESEIQISRMLPTFINLFKTVNKLVSLAVNLTNQMLALYNKNFKNYSLSFKNFLLYKPFEYLSNIFGYFNAIDIIYNENENLQNDWKLYKLMFHKTKSNCNKFNYTEFQGNKLEKYIRQLDNSILSGRLLQFLTKHIINSTGDQDSFKGTINSTLLNKEYCNHFANYLKYKAEKFYCDIGNITESNEKYQLFNTLSLLSYYSKLFEVNKLITSHAVIDKDVFKSFWNILKKINYIPILLHINFSIPEFYKSTIIQYNNNSKYDISSTLSYKKSQFKNLLDNFEKYIFNLKLQVITWISRTNSSVFDIKVPIDSFGKINESRVRLIINGVILAYQIKNILINCLNTHLSENKELKGSLISSICLAMELLKAIELQFSNKLNNVIALNINAITKVLTYDIQIILESIEKKLYSSLSNNIDAFKSDAFSAIKILKSNLNSATSKIRMIINDLCFDLVKNKLITDQKQIDNLNFNQWRLNVIYQLSSVIKSVCNCSFFYWYKDILPECFNFIYKNSFSINRLFLFCLAISDTEYPLIYSKHLDNENKLKLINNYKKSIIDLLINNLFYKFATDVENDLRYHIHSVLIDELKSTDSINNSLNNSNSKILRENIIDFEAIMNLKNIKLFEFNLNLKYYIQNYLNKIFYDMTTMNLNDYKTYQQMRTLAKTKFNLNLHEVNLPSQTLEQGLDSLYILRNINSFVQNYYYNLHSQIFIEITNESNYITVIGMQQILNSLNTHGTGIINSIVNKIYQFLIQRLKSISNIINDEYIKSSLIIEKRFWLDNKEKLNNLYPFERAEQLMNDIKQYAKSDLTTIIDHLRSYIAHLGNALAYVRTIKAALTEYQNQSLKYFSLGSSSPSLLVDYIKNITNADEITKNTGNILNETLTLLDRTGNKKTNYLVVLIDTFEDIFTSKNIPDIDLFYFLIPALMINYVETLIVAKDKLFKKNIKEAYISDDGFVLGIVYILKVFKQESLFDSLHWFNSSIEKFKNEEESFGNKNNYTSTGNLEKKMTLRKVEVYLKELELLSFTYNSSAILFNNY